MRIDVEKAAVERRYMDVQINSPVIASQIIVVVGLLSLELLSLPLVISALNKFSAVLRALHLPQVKNPGLFDENGTDSTTAILRSLD